ATNSVWVTKNWFSAESRCRSVEFMLREQRVPRYAVRCLIHPEGIGSPDGGRMQPYLIDERLDPVHTFVRTHFCRIGTVFPFEVWERSDIAAAASDPRPSLRLREEFNGWTGPERVNNIDTAGTLLQCGGERGQYAFERKMEAGGAYLETRLVKQTVGDAPVLQLQHSLSAGLHGGQLATLVAVVRLSLGARCQLFIQDRTAAGWQRTTALLGPSTTWTTASVEAAVRDGVVQASAGFYFEPASEGQSLEIKSMELLVEP
ncbi:MAG: hypothetical protein NTW87_31660, partial [Planctomycetota bacterium]|nr:hypothetical protein [Planctomycetota bacterium]